MSYIFEIDGLTVWSPSLDIGVAYVGAASGLADALKIETGFNSISEDMVDIDRNIGSNYVRRLTEVGKGSRSQPVLADLIGAVLPAFIVMLQRASVAVDVRGDESWAGRVRELQGMPR